MLIHRFGEGLSIILPAPAKTEHDKEKDDIRKEVGAKESDREKGDTRKEGGAKESDRESMLARTKSLDQETMGEKEKKKELESDDQHSQLKL